MNSHAARPSGKLLIRSDALPELLSRKSSGREVLQRVRFTNDDEVRSLRREQPTWSEVL
jgi:hypothetical protein